MADKLTYYVSLDGEHPQQCVAEIENGRIVIPDPPRALLPPESVPKPPVYLKEGVLVIESTARALSAFG